jgi:hypothetical protein
MLLRSRAIQIVAGVIILLLAFQLTLTALNFRDTTSASTWVLSYVDRQGRSISEVKEPPTGDGAIEDMANGPVSVELTFPECRAYDRYRFWVGPFGADSTTRQPEIWNVHVQADSGQWVNAGSEQMKEEYSNNHWYTFPLHYELPCFRRMRMEITKLVGGGNLFRLFEIQVYRSTFLDWILRRS